MVPKSASVLGTQPIHPGRGTKTGPNPALLTKATEAPELPVQPSVGYKKSEVVPRTLLGEIELRSFFLLAGIELD